MPTERSQTLNARRPTTPEHDSRSERTDSSPSQSNENAEDARRCDGRLRFILGPAARDAATGYNSPSRRPESPSRRASVHHADRSRLRPGESAPADARRRDERSIGSASVPARTSDRLNPPGLPSGSTRLPLNGFTYS